MKALILLGALKKDEPSNIEALSDFFIGKLEKKGMSCEVVKLADEHFLPGTYSEKNYASTADKMAAQLKRFAKQPAYNLS